MKVLIYQIIREKECFNAKNIHFTKNKGVFTPNVWLIKDLFAPLLHNFSIFALLLHRDINKYTKIC